MLLFAATYVVLVALSASNFGQHLSHTDGLYSTVTVFSTVGFGDITAKTEAARLVVTGQMIADLIVLGLAIKVIVGAVRHSRADRTRFQFTAMLADVPRIMPCQGIIPSGRCDRQPRALEWNDG